MQETSDLYKKLLQSDHFVETRLAIGDTMGADDGFSESRIISMSTQANLFSQNSPTVGNCVSGEIDITLIEPEISIPRNAKLRPFVRLSNGTETSEWIQKGVYYIDTRETQKGSSGLRILSIHGYDAMLKAEVDYIGSDIDWPAKDIDVVSSIAAVLGVSVDARTAQVMTAGFDVQFPSGYSCREILGYIAAMYAGCFVMSDLGELRLIPLWNAPRELSQLADESGNVLIVGGVSILV